MSSMYCFSIPDIFCPTCVNTVMAQLRPPISFWQRFSAFFSSPTANNVLHKKITLNEKTLTILDVRVNLACHQITVTTEEEELTDIDVMNLLNIELDAIGFSCCETTSPVVTSTSSFNLRWLLGFSGVGAGIALLMLPWIAGPLSLFAMTFIAIPSVALTLVLGAESFKKAAKMLFKGHLHMDTLFAISSLTAMAASIVALFVPGFPMMFEAGLLIFGFRHIGEGIRESLERSMALKARFQDRVSKQVRKIQDGHVENVATHTIQAGDLISIEEGDVVPVDGICEAGEGILDRSIEYGNHEPMTLKSGDPVSAGTILKQGSMQLRVTAAACASLLARKDASIAKSLGAKDETTWKTEADKALQYFIPMVFGLALLSGMVVGCFFPLTLAIQSVVAVLVSACPCTLGLVTGLVIRVGMKKAADHHLEFKSTKKLEEVDLITHVGFDLNGTLTTTEPEVMEFSHTSGLYEDVLKYALMLEQRSHKAVGMAIHYYASQKIWMAEMQSVSVDESHHSGVKAIIDGEMCMIGNQNMMREHHISMSSYQHRALESDETIMYLARGQTILGHFILKRPLRPEAVDVVNALKKMGKQVHIFTGADEETALRYANILKIPADNIRFLMTSADKVNCIKVLQDSGKQRVAMIGDGENDADAIAASDFGVAMPTDGRSKRGNMNRQIADAESRISSLEPVVAAFEISRQTGMNIRQNLVFSWSYNIAALLLPVGLLLATGIALNPGVAVALMILQTSLILLNTYWFKQQDLVCLKEAKEGRAMVAEESSYEAVTSMMPTPKVYPTPSLVSLLPQAGEGARRVDEGAHIDNNSPDNALLPSIF